MLLHGWGTEQPFAKLRGFPDFEDFVSASSHCHVLLFLWKLWGADVCRQTRWIFDICSMWPISIQEYQAFNGQQWLWDCGLNSWCLTMFVFPYFFKGYNWISCNWATFKMLVSELILYCIFWKHLKALWNSTLYVMQRSFWIKKHRDILDTDHRYMKNVTTSTRCSYLNWGDTKKAGLCYFQDTESCREGLFKLDWNVRPGEFLGFFCWFKDSAPGERDFQVRCVRRLPVWCKPFATGTVLTMTLLGGYCHPREAPYTAGPGHERWWLQWWGQHKLRASSEAVQSGHLASICFRFDIPIFPKLLSCFCVLNSSRYQHGRHLPVRLRGQTLQ